MLCIDKAYDQVGGKKHPILTCVDPIADITARIPLRDVVNGAPPAPRRGGASTIFGFLSWSGSDPGTGAPMSRCPHPRLATQGAEGLQRYMEDIMAFFVRHFEMMIT